MMKFFNLIPKIKISDLNNSQSYLISVVIPTYNASDNIENALKSLQFQTYQNFEIILKDGFSTDNTLAIANQYKEVFKNRLRIYSDRDKGIYDAMNKAILVAKGTWLYFMGSDDTLFENTTLNDVFDIINDNDCRLLFGQVSTNFKRNLNIVEQINVQTILKSNICHQGIFYKRDIFEELGMYDLKYKIFSDWDFNLRCLIAKIPFKALNNTIACYGINGISHQIGDKHFHRDLCYLIPKYQFLFCKGKAKITVLPSLIRGYIILLRKRFRLL